MSWIDSVEEHKETIEKLAQSDLPLSGEMEQLLEEYRRETGSYPDGVNIKDRRYVYVARSEGGEVKIGKSKDPKSRIKSLSTGNPQPLHLVKSAKVPNAGELEKKMHERYQEYRLHGEWFDLPESEIDSALEELEEHET